MRQRIDQRLVRSESCEFGAERSARFLQRGVVPAEVLLIRLPGQCRLHQYGCFAFQSAKARPSSKRKIDFMRIEDSHQDYFMPIVPQTWHYRQSIDYEMTQNRAVVDFASRNYCR